MPTKVMMPQLGESVVEGTIAGILKFLIPEGGVAPVGSEIALIAQEGEAAVEKKAEPSSKTAVPAEEPRLSPLVRRLAEEHRIDLSDLAARAREQRLLPDDLAGGTFTVTNPGKKGNLFGTPILIQPQVGVLRLGEVTKRPIAVERNGQDVVAIRPMMFLALSYDHRVIDGVTGNAFLHRVKEILQEGKFAL